MTTTTQTTDTIQTAPVTLYYRKIFVSGLLKGMTYLDSTRFPSIKTASDWAKKHRTVPVKAIGGSNYLVDEPAFQSYAR